MKNERSYFISNAVIEGATGDELATYTSVLKLIYSSDKEANNIDVSTMTLAKMLKCSTRTIQRRIKTLAEKGFIKVERHNGKPSTFTLMDGFGNPLERFVEMEKPPSDGNG